MMAAMMIMPRAMVMVMSVRQILAAVAMVVSEAQGWSSQCWRTRTKGTWPNKSRTLLRIASRILMKMMYWSGY